MNSKLSLPARVGRSVAVLAMAGAAAFGAQGQAATASPAAPTATLRSPQTLSHGLFSDVRIYRPGGTPRQFVMMISANDRPDPTEQALIDRMVGDGAMVAAIPLPPFYRRLEQQDGKCTYAAGAFENLARHIQAFDQLPTYLLPMVMGTGRAASFAYVVLAQAPAGTFASGLALDFCPRLMVRTPPCPSTTVKTRSAADGSLDLEPGAPLSVPWTAMQGPGADASCKPAKAAAFVARLPPATWLPAAGTPSRVPAGFQAAYEALAANEKGLAPPPAQLADLPVVELPVAGSGTRLVVLLSGDGGWAAIDKGIANALVKQGVPVVGIDSLRYFWSQRTPDGLAADLDRVIRFYADRWKRSEIVLIGYSQGADVLPFAVNRLPPRTRQRVRLTALLGLGQMASFEFHVSHWIGPSGDRPILPEAQKLNAAETLCVYGQDETDSLCPSLAPAHARLLALPGGHHFGGDYDALASRMLEAIGR